MTGPTEGAGALFSSLTRIADIERGGYRVTPLPKDTWAVGDYVEAEVTGERSALYELEVASGEMLPIAAGDRIVGAFGDRAATLEGVGSFRAIEDDHIHCLTSAGLFGAFTSLSPFLPRPVSAVYRGHVLRRGKKLTMDDFAVRAEGRFTLPTLLIVGTSMSAGKTLTGTLACRVLSGSGSRVIGAKLTGAARYRDILSFRNAGASEIFDFVDAGMPSTVLDERGFRERIRPLLAHIGGRRADVLVAEAGASPLEPYNGAAAIDELGDNIRCTILCASDPYAVAGVVGAFGIEPDLVCGPAANTSAGIDLVGKLTGIEALNIADPAAADRFRGILHEKLMPGNAG